MREHVGLVARFGLVGLINTAVGFAVVVALDPGLHVAPAIANGVGYLVGVGVGFILNRGFVFRSGEGVRASGLRYAIAALGRVRAQPGCPTAGRSRLRGGRSAAHRRSALRHGDLLGRVLSRLPLLGVPVRALNRLSRPRRSQGCA